MPVPTVTSLPWVCEPVRGVDSIRPPLFATPAKLCDAHMHVFGPLSNYPAAAGARYDWPGGDLDHYLGVAGKLGIARIVLVQPSFYGQDNSCMVAAMRVLGDRCRGVVFMPDMRHDAELEELRRIGVRGVRLDLFKAVDRGETIQAMKARLLGAADLARDFGWHVELYSPGAVTHQLIDALARLDAPFSVNHLGYMAPADGMTDNHFRDFVELVGSTEAWVKLTAPYRLKPESTERTRDMAMALIEAAPERIVWGTDWPHIPTGALDTGLMLNLLQTWCPDPDRRDAILAENPARLYQFE